MDKDLEILSKEELFKLKEELVIINQNIDKRLKAIDIKNIKPEKGTLLSLKSGDKIFGIRLSFGAHKLAEPKELNGKVDVIDYCNITGIELRGDSDDFRINISHPEVPFGVSTTLLKDKYKYEHCLLNIDTMKTGYDAFYTLKPDSWKEDLKKAYEKFLYYREKYWQEELKIYQNKLNLFLDAEEEINKLI